MVIIDIFRATTAICAAVHNRVEKIIPVKTIEEALTYKGKDYILASERQGVVVDGFDMGNSPQAFLDPGLKNKTIIFTTTNGTDAIFSAIKAKHILIGSFINLSAIVKMLVELNEDTLLVCAGWKNKFNLEDSLFAGAVVSEIKGHIDCSHCDAAIAAEMIYKEAQKDLLTFLFSSAHYNRLKHLHLEEDMKFSIQTDLTTSVPCFKDGEIRNFI